MAYTYDFMKFIESPALKEYLSADMFTPGEQAVLISKSYRSMEEKIEALQYIKERYGKNFYCPRPKCENRECVKRNILLMDLIDRTVAYWQSVLDKRMDNKNVIFAAQLREKGFDREYVEDYRYFTDYEKAYFYLKEEKKEYLEDDDLKDVVTYGQIIRIPLNNTECCKGSAETYNFNNDLELFSLSECSYDNWGDIQARILEDYWVYVPTPFKIRDVLKCDFGKSGVLFGEVDYDFDKVFKRRFEYLCSRGDDSDSIVELAYFEKDEKRWTILDAHVLNLSYAAKEECADIPKYDGTPI